MVELDGWINDTELSARFPYYTRANADEVGPEPFTPLGWSLGWIRGCIPGVAKGFVTFGVLEYNEFTVDPPEVFGNWGGYFYNQLSLPRLMGVRMPGASPEAIDQAYFGDHPGVPPYMADPADINETRSAKLAETMEWVMSTTSFSAQDEASAIASEIVEARPELASLSNEELIERARETGGAKLEEVWVAYCQSSLAASLGPGAVQAICATIGRDSDAVKVMTAIGNVESAQASLAMWNLSRVIRNSPKLMMVFDDGVDEVLSWLTPTGVDDEVEFRTGWDELIAHHGHRGPNEWDMGAPSWTTQPTLALGMLERLRHRDDTKSPVAASERARIEREALTTELLEMVQGDEAQRSLQAAISSAALFLTMREKGKNSCIKLLHEAKLAILTLGTRFVESGDLERADDVFMLLDDELDAFLGEAGSFVDAIATRRAGLEHLRSLEPPYIVGPDRPVPPISEWRPRVLSTAATAIAGEVLQGAPGAPGVIVGIARIMLDPSDPGAVGVGDIIVAPTTDPSWMPLFLAAEGIVVNVGAVASHAAIVSRELGIPCAVSVHHATDRIPHGATIEVDGSTGQVTVVSVP